jgi:hypothetical protein
VPRDRKGKNQIHNYFIIDPETISVKAKSKLLLPVDISVFGTAFSLYCTSREVEQLGSTVTISDPHFRFRGMEFRSLNQLF